MFWMLPFEYSTGASLILSINVCYGKDNFWGELGYF